VFAVVDHKQAIEAAGGVPEHVEQRPSRLGDDAQGSCERVGDELGSDRREVCQSRAVGKLVRLLGGDVHGEPGLADTTRSEERDQAVAGDGVDDRRGLEFTPDQRRERDRQRNGRSGRPPKPVGDPS
jgi:hypothetical protein